MRLAWEYELPVREEPSDHNYEGPICVTDDKVFFATTAFEHPRETRAVDRNQRGSILSIHALDRQSGKAGQSDFRLPSCSIPSMFSFVRYDDQLLFHCGHLLAIQPSPGILDLDFTMPQPIKGAARPRFLFIGSKMIFADAKESRLLAFDVPARRLSWEVDLNSAKPYCAGPPLLAGNDIACYGRDALNFIDPTSGTITNVLQIPRIDKLFSPVSFADDLLLGYTNWSVGGVLRYSPATKKVVWRYRKKTSGPCTYCKVFLIGETIIWVKGETEIIGLDADSGEEKWAYGASPWLYTELATVNDNLIFGTAGRDGFMQVLDAESGRTRWSKFLKNGCAFFDYYRDSLVVGDFEGILHRLRISDGKELDRLNVSSQVVGDLVVQGESAYTVVWFSPSGKPPRLIRVDLE